MIRFIYVLGRDIATQRILGLLRSFYSQAEFIVQLVTKSFAFQGWIGLMVSRNRSILVPGIRGCPGIRLKVNRLGTKLCGTGGELRGRLVLFGFYSGIGSSQRRLVLNTICLCAKIRCLYSSRFGFVMGKIYFSQYFRLFQEIAKKDLHT